MDINQQSVLQNYSSWNEIVAFQEDPFLFSNQQLPPFPDFSGYYYDEWGFPMPLQEMTVLDTIPLMESFPTDPLYSSLDILPSQPVFQDEFYNGYANNNDQLAALLPSGHKEMAARVKGIEDQETKQIVLYDSKNIGQGSSTSDQELQMDNLCSKGENKKMKKCRDHQHQANRINLSSNDLSRETISRYFYMPITQAAKELNVGLTLLKKRCRELGIPRWPHRKLMSLQTLIKNVQEMAAKNDQKGDGNAAEKRIREALELLEEQKKLMEEMPGVQLEEKTKRLRQACFKANYKKRRLMAGMVDLHPYASSTSSTSSSSSSSCSSSSSAMSSLFMSN